MCSKLIKMILFWALKFPCDFPTGHFSVKKAALFRCNRGIHLVRPQNFRKINISYPLIGTCAYQGVTNVSFLENFAFVLNEWTHDIHAFFISKAFFLLSLSVPLLFHELSLRCCLAHSSIIILRHFLFIILMPMCRPTSIHKIFETNSSFYAK